MSRSLKFANILSRELRDGVVKQVKSFYVVSGRLDIGATYVSIRILVPKLFKTLKRCPFCVWCDEPWMKAGADWHNSEELGMCWVLDDEWYDAMSWKGKSVRRIMDEGRDWFVNNVRNLINRHYVAHLEGVTEWPVEWDAWSHYKKGRIEYAREKRLRKPA